MSVHALAGLAGLNALYLVAGAAFLWTVRGAADWIDVARLAGLAYLVGVVLVGAIWTLLLIAGVAFSLVLVLVLPVALTVGFLVVGRWRGRAVPRGGRIEGGSRLIVTAVGIAAAGVLLEGLFRRARLAGLYEFDGWSFWIPKAKAIYEFGDLDQRFFTSLPGAAYPPLVPTLDAAAFHAMGSADVVTLHVQYWLLGVGFVAALAGLLARRVAPWMLWPFVLLLLLAPRIGRRFQITEADMFLDFQFVLAAVLFAVWLTDRKRWRLIVATVLLCGMVQTKREGLLFFALLAAASLIASVRQWRTTWPSLAVAFAVVVAVAIPWRLWYVVHDVAGEGPSGGFVQPDNLRWLWPAVHRALDVFWDPGYWNLIVPVALAALLLAAFARVGTLVVYFGSLLVFAVLGGMWATWVFSKPWITGELGGNFIIRFMGASALLCVAGAPLLLSATWTRITPADGRDHGGKRRLGLATAIVVVPLLTYPLVALADGGPRFPTRGECARPVVDGKPVDIVYGRFDSPLDAVKLRDQVVAVGFIGTEVRTDACGQWKVVYEDAPTVDVARQVQVEARRVGLDPTLELATER